MRATSKELTSGVLWMRKYCSALDNHPRIGPIKSRDRDPIDRGAAITSGVNDGALSSPCGREPLTEQPASKGCWSDRTREPEPSSIAFPFHPHSVRQKRGNAIQLPGQGSDFSDQFLAPFLYRCKQILRIHVVLASQLLCWTGQFIGHGVFERRAPALLDNLAQAFLMAPYFVLLEALQSAFGYEPYPGFHARVQAKVDADIKSWKEKKIS
ncbi:hypothetical protein OROMI_003315 [Orobanche minor]